MIFRHLVRLCLTCLPCAAWAVECEPVEHDAIHATACTVDPAKDQLRLFLRDERGKYFHGFAAIDDWLRPRGQRLAFAMNAGMFRPDYSPSGLYIADGVRLAPLETRKGHGNFFLRPNGVFLLDGKGAHVVETSEYARLHEPVKLATQSGPLLLHRGEIHAAFNAGSASRLIRNGVGVRADGTVVFAISDTPVNFHEFAILFRDTLQCPDALYLDGNVSSLHAPMLGRSDAPVPLGPIVGIAVPPQ